MTQIQVTGDLPAKFLGQGSANRVSGNRVSGGQRAARQAWALAVLLAVSGCQSVLTPDAWDHGGVSYASARRGDYGNRLKPMDLTLSPGVTYGGCLVVESVKQDHADFGLGLVC